MTSPAGRPAARRLIVNADDFGLSPGVNAAVREAALRGILTSASLLANAPHFDEAVGIAQGIPRLGVGVHLNLVRGRPLSRPEQVPELVGPDGRFRPFRRREMTRAFIQDATREYRRQIEKILAAGIVPTHIDFEKHHAWQRRLYLCARRRAREYGIPAIRNLREPVFWSLWRLGWPGTRRFLMAAAMRCGLACKGRRFNLRSPDRLLGGTHIGGINETVWLRLAANLPPGVSEAMVHPALPGEPAGAAGPDMGAVRLADRGGEFLALVSDRVRRAVADGGVELISYRDL